MEHLPKILFVCTYRGGRSQIANAYAEKHGEGIVDASCACFDPDTINQDFVDLISSFGIQIDRKSPKSVFDPNIRKSEYHSVICMCSSVGTEMCSLFRTNIDRIFPNAPNRIHWDILDFAACKDAPEGFRECAKGNCQTIENKVVELIESIKSELAAGS
ncbi:hypothetical protein [Pelagicoccus albus]